MDGGVASDLVAGTACYGQADRLQSAMITGWVVAPAHAKMTAYVDGEPAGEAMVAQAGQRLGEAPEHARAFSYGIPPGYQDGRSHLLALMLADGTAITFPARGGVTRANVRFRFEETRAAHRSVPEGTDLALQARATPILGSGSDYVGIGDHFRGSPITGWAVCRLSPQEAVRLRVFVDGHAAGEVVCDRTHEGLTALGASTGSGGFAFEIPERFMDGLPHSLSMLFGDGTAFHFKDEFGGSQDRIAFTAEPVTSIEGIVDGLQGEKIRGWAVRKNHRTGAIEGSLRIEVLCNGIGVGELSAEQPRMDVGRELRCNPAVGFDFALPAHCRNGQEFEFVFRVLPEGEQLAGCPLPVRHRQADDAHEMRALAETLGDLCAKAFRLQRQVREMLPVAEATVQNYDAWARRYHAGLRNRMQAAQLLPDDAPLVSVIMPTYRTNLAHLTAAIESVRAQTYGNWELVIVDDGSRSRALGACLRGYAETDPRIAVIMSPENHGISGATNRALRRARGDYVVLFDHDDLMVEVALEALVREVLRTGAKVVYSDEDKIDSFGVLSEPNLKPDWNYRLLLGINYICHLLIIERALLRRLGPLRSECDGAQDHDLLLRLSERCGPGQIVHLPEILYHWRKSASSTAEFGEAKEYAIEAGRRAVTDHLARRGFKENVVTSIGRSTSYSVAWNFSEQPSVTVIVPFKDHIAATRRCLDYLLANTEWNHWRVVLVDNGSVTPEAEAFCREAAKDPHVVVRRVDEPFNYSRLNNIAASENPADYYVFLNNDVFIEQPNWLRVMVDETLADPRVAIVGAKLLYPNGTVQHAGVILGVGGIADHVFRGIPADHPGFLYRAKCAQRYSAVTAACMLCRSDVFMDIGGFDEQDLMVAFNDVDLCLKAGARGWQVVWTPALVAEHHESLSRGDDISAQKAQRFFFENHVMLERWHALIAADPFYSPHFSRDRGIFTDLR